MRLRRRVAALVGGLLAVIVVSAGVTVALAEYFPELLPSGPQGTRGPEGVQGPRGERGPAGPRGSTGEPGDSAVSGVDDAAPSAPENEPKHYYYGGEDLGTVAQHEQFCRALRSRQASDGVNDQDELEREGCRGGGLIARPSER
jgi:hypothetical protein